MKQYITLAVVVIILIGGVFLLRSANTRSFANMLQSFYSPATSTPSSVQMLFVGDIMMGRNVELLMDQNGDEYPFEKISPFLSSYPIVVANLEGPVLEDHTRTPSNSFRFNFQTKVPSILAAQNISIVSLANNHTYDFGADGYTETRDYVQAAGIDTVGHPYIFNNSYILRKTINGQKFVFVGFNITNPNFEFAKAHAFVKNLKKDKHEFLIALIHGGDEYKLSSNTTQQAFYRGLIDDGVQLVVAHHPHVVEEIEVYKGKPIFYSLGNFIFDQYFEKNVLEGLSVAMTKTPTTLHFELFPTNGNHSQTSLMEGARKQQFLKELAERSSKSIKSQIEKGVIDVSL